MGKNSLPTRNSNERDRLLLDPNKEASPHVHSRTRSRGVLRRSPRLGRNGATGTLQHSGTQLRSRRLLRPGFVLSTAGVRVAGQGSNESSGGLEPGSGVGEQRKT